MWGGARIGAAPAPRLANGPAQGPGKVPHTYLAIKPQNALIAHIHVSYNTQQGPSMDLTPECAQWRAPLEKAKTTELTQRFGGPPRPTGQSIYKNKT